MRTHVILPENLVRAIDSLVGKRKRSRFVEEAIEEKLRREVLIDALERTAGAFRAEDHPEWSTSEDVAEWVSNLRGQDRDRREGDTE